MHGVCFALALVAMVSVFDEPGRVRFSKGVIAVEGDDPWSVGARMILDRLAIELFRPSGPRRVRLEGHAWHEGSTARMVAIAQARADAVREYLIGKGIDAKRLQAVGYGDTRPIERTPNTEENWRVDLIKIDLRE